MGRNNKERRRLTEKARKRGGDGLQPAGASFRRPVARGDLPHALDVEIVVGRAEIRALTALDLGRAADVDRIATELAALTLDPADRRLAEVMLSKGVRESITALWRTGWQPADVARMATRKLDAPTARIARAAMAEELQRYARDRVDPVWWAQCEAADIPLDRRGGVLPAAADLWGGATWPQQVARVFRVLHLLRTLPPLPVLTPLPGTADARRAASEAARRADVDERVLARVRALLAKAESTTYPAEAEAFTAGAQALMARHSIDVAMLGSEEAASKGPVSRRLGLDPPYEDAKAMLFQAVAEANRCRTAWSKAFGFVTVVGFPADIRAVETLVTSLLVQAAQAVKGAGPQIGAYGTSRTRSFRRSFLMSFAARIGERLSEATRSESERLSGEQGYEDLLPVLARRDARVDEELTRLFPEMVSKELSRGHDREGWARGRAAADMAALQYGFELD